MSAYGASDADRKRAQRLRTLRTKHERGHGPPLRASDAKWLARYEEHRYSHVRAIPEVERVEREARDRTPLRVVPPPDEEMVPVSFDDPSPPASSGGEDNPTQGPTPSPPELGGDDVPLVEAEPVDDVPAHVETCGNENCQHCRKRKGLSARVESICPVTKGPIYKPPTETGMRAFAVGVFFVTGLVAMLVAKLMGHPNPRLVEPTDLELEMMTKYLMEIAKNRAPWVAMFDDFFGFFGTVGLFARRAYSEGKGPAKLASVTPIREGAGAPT